jgi:SpoVK/Ycf46/Vps4 family AAA+-type ATPase
VPDETEANLDVAFRQAEKSWAVLFFDEADPLVGKRGDVKHGRGGSPSPAAAALASDVDCLHCPGWT